MRKFWLTLLGLGGVLVLALVVAVAYVVWDYAREHAVPETGHEAAGSKGYVEVNWIVGVHSPAGTGRRMHLRIPREYKMEVVRSRQTLEENTTIDNNGIQTISIQAWMPELSPNPPAAMRKKAETEEAKRKVKEALSKRLWVQLRAAGGGTVERVHNFTKHRFRTGDMYRREDFHGLEWYVPMGCSDRIREIKTPKPPDDQSPDGCRETYGDHEFLPPGRPVWIKCRSLKAGVCVYRGNPDWWSLEIEIPSWELSRWEAYERAALALIKKFQVPESGKRTESQHASKSG